MATFTVGPESWIPFLKSSDLAVDHGHVTLGICLAVGTCIVSVAGAALAWCKFCYGVHCRRRANAAAVAPQVELVPLSSGPSTAVAVVNGQMETEV